MGRLAFDFPAEVAIVTGASAGIGLEIARALSAAGARVHGFDLRPPAAESALPGAMLSHTVDVRDPAAVEAAVAAVQAREGRIDLLVNNAGLTRDGLLWKLADSAWREVLDVNLTGAFYVLRAVANVMRPQRRGRIVQIASINGLRGRAGQANYSASKAGLIGLTRTAARELGPRGITVNVIAPGLIETGLIANLPPEARERSLAETALGRLGRPSDVASAVLFLLSEQAAHITGAVLPVDGGQLA